MKNSYSTKNCLRRPFHTSNNQVKRYKIIREYLPNLNQIPLKINIERDTSSKKELLILNQIWDELDISNLYREAFAIYISYLSDEYKNNIIIQEQNNLKKFKKVLINLKKEISLRENNIQLLKGYNDRLVNFNNQEYIMNIIEEVTSLVKKLRRNAINIIQDYSKIEKISKNYSNLSLAKDKIIKDDYTYDPNYINKMQDDLLFLKESSLGKYFEMDNKYIDPFLTNFCTATRNTKKYSIDNPIEIMRLINESRYILFKDKIFAKINSNKDMNNSESNSVKKYTRNFSSKFRRRIEYKNTNTNENVEINSIDKYINDLKKLSPSKYKQLFLKKKNSSRDIHNIKKQINLFHKVIKPNRNYRILNIDLISKRYEEFKNKEINQYINIKYYTNDINLLLKALKEKITLDKINHVFKSAFNLDDFIYKKDIYLKGVFPKILLITKDEENERYKNNNINNIIGLCSFYYEFNERPKYLKLNINHILSNDNNNYEKIITKVINFIKSKEKFDRMEINIINNEYGERLIKVLKKELQFNQSKIEKNQKDEYQLITLSYEQTKEQENNKDIFVLRNKFITIINNNNNKRTKTDNANNINEKFINRNIIYYSLLENKNIKIEFQDESKLKEIKSQKEKLKSISEFEFNYKIKDNDIELKEINNNGMLYKINLNINFENCYSIIINDIYYNKIMSEQMKLFKTKKTNSVFFLIPSKDSSYIFCICEIIPELKNLLINNNNIYQTFLDFYSNSILNFALLERTKKSVYIPSFVLKKNLSTNNLKDIENNIKIYDNEKTKKPLYISFVNEFLNVEFNHDSNIKNNFVDNNNIYNDGYLIKNEFIFAIFKNDIINKENKLNLIQVLYVEKDNFRIKNNTKK